MGMFGLIGAEISIDNMDANTMGNGIAVLTTCLILRLVGTFCAVSFAGFNMKEKIFLCLAWLPKATVQAAIGSIALDTARSRNTNPAIIRIGEQILTIAVLSILLTAPLGATAIGLSGPKLLQKHDVRVKTNFLRQVMPIPGLVRAKVVQDDEEEVNKRDTIVVETDDAITADDVDEGSTSPSQLERHCLRQEASIQGEDVV